MSFFNVKVEGLDSLDKDFEIEMTGINKQISIALNIVGAEMITNLQRHIENDFYRRYDPKSYKRRADNSQYGTSMKDDSNMNYNAKGDQLEFIYMPVTSHSQLDVWMQDKPVKSAFPLPRTPDDLIIWGQTEHFDGQIPARPFWNLFLDEQGNEKILDNFARGMLPNYKVEKDAGETVDLSDSQLPADEAQISFNISFDDEGLPY